MRILAVLAFSILNVEATVEITKVEVRDWLQEADTQVNPPRPAVIHTKTG